MTKSIWIGYDPREQDAFQVAAQSIMAQAKEPLAIHAVRLEILHGHGLYQRPTVRRGGQLWDVISDAPMSTEFAISRFFVPTICRNYCAEPYDWALFMDCDMLARADLNELFALADPEKAVQVVKHEHSATLPSPGQENGPQVKMDGQVQTYYPRKNWSSVMLWNLKHPANLALTIGKLNSWAGRALHGFQWLDDSLIGELPHCWNHLVGVDQPDPDAKLVHFTLGVPSMQGYANCEHAAEWWGYRAPLVIQDIERPKRCH